MPSQPFRLFDIFRINVRPHITAVEGFILFEVHDVQSHFFLAEIPYCKVEPLDMPPCICVHSHKQIILIIPNFNHSVYIPTLELTIEDHLISSLNGRIHSPKNTTWVFRFEICMKLLKVRSHVGERPWNSRLVLEAILVQHLLMHFKTAYEPIS